MKQFAANHGLVTEFGYVGIDKVKADTGSQFTSNGFKILQRTRS